MTDYKERLINSLKEIEDIMMHVSNSCIDSTLTPKHIPAGRLEHLLSVAAEQIETALDEMYEQANNP